MSQFRHKLYKLYSNLKLQINHCKSFIPKLHCGITHITLGLQAGSAAAAAALKFDKVLGQDNRADLFTKYLDWKTIRMHSEMISVIFEDGRAATAPELRALKAVWKIGAQRPAAIAATHNTAPQHTGT